MTDAFGFDDASKRCADQVNLHAVAGGFGRWVAIRLSDGGSDGVLYDTRRDAIRHQLHETLCAYIVVPLIGMQYREAQAVLHVHRKTYDQGHRMADPEGRQAEPMIPIREESYRGRLGR